MADNQTPNTIDRALEDCKAKIEYYKKSSTISLTLLGVSILLLLGIQGIFYKNKESNVSSFQKSILKLELINQDLENNIKQATALYQKLSPSAPDSIYTAYYKSSLRTLSGLDEEMAKLSVQFDSTSEIIGYGLFILIFGVLTSFYRYFLKEAAKYEHFLFGLHRIRIAANNSKTGFEDEVKTALTQNAFSTEAWQPESMFKRKSKIESPIPGHPTSDATTFLLNKIWENLDITFKTKEK